MTNLRWTMTVADVAHSPLSLEARKVYSAASSRVKFMMMRTLCTGSCKASACHTWNLSECSMGTPDLNQVQVVVSFFSNSTINLRLQKSKPWIFVYFLPMCSTRNQHTYTQQNSVTLPESKTDSLDGWSFNNFDNSLEFLGELGFACNELLFGLRERERKVTHTYPVASCLF